jgi:hypothetical protein
MNVTYIYIYLKQRRSTDATITALNVFTLQTEEVTFHFSVIRDFNCISIYTFRVMKHTNQ